MIKGERMDDTKAIRPEPDLDRAWAEAKLQSPLPLVGFTNRDSGCPEWVRIDKIVRVSECQHPDHKGFALLSLEVGLETVLIEADSTVDEFISRVRDAFDA
jgi:hypothetical protein